MQQGRERVVSMHAGCGAAPRARCIRGASRANRFHHSSSFLIPCKPTLGGSLASRTLPFPCQPGSHPSTPSPARRGKIPSSPPPPPPHHTRTRVDQHQGVHLLGGGHGHTQRERAPKRLAHQHHARRLWQLLLPPLLLLRLLHGRGAPAGEWFSAGWVGVRQRRCAGRPSVVLCGP